MSRLLKVSLVAALFVAPALARAATNLWCQGKLINVLVTDTGEVHVKPEWRGDWIMLCKLETDGKACASWLAQALMAVQSGKQTMITYWGIPPTACKDMPIYSAAPKPGYVMTMGN